MGAWRIIVNPAKWNCSRSFDWATGWLLNAPQYNSQVHIGVARVVDRGET